MHLIIFVLLLSFLGNPAAFGMAVLVCAGLCAPLALYLWRLRKRDMAEWAASLANRAEWQAKAEANNKRVAAKMWEAQVKAYSRNPPASDLSNFEDKSFPAPKCFSDTWGAK